MTTWLITGCSTGLGRALAEAVLRHGDNLVATARNPETLADLVAAHTEQVQVLALDVTDPSAIDAAVAAAGERFNSIDVLVNNAGYGYRGAVEEGEDTAVRTLFDTNFFGAVAMIKAVLPLMRHAGSGTIVNISSIGARLSPPGSGYYAASKAALEALTASLAKEVAPLGIRAFSVEPGGFRTDFAGRSLVGSDVVISDYDATVAARRKPNDTAHGTQRGDPEKAAEAIIAAVRSPTPPAMLVLGPDAVEGFSGALDALRADLDTWRQLSLGTDLDGV